MATALILHVIAIGVVLSRFRLRSYTIFGFFLYFLAVYIGLGHYMKTHRETITPVLPLEDDYYKHYRPEKKSPFDPSQESSKETEEDVDETMRYQKKLFEENKAQPSTKP